MAKKSFKIKENLTKALEDTIASAQNHNGELNIQLIPIKNINADIANPRDLKIDLTELLNNQYDYNISEKNIHNQINDNLSDLNSLKESIKTHGIINPILVYKEDSKYKLIAGHRRTFAAVLAKLNTIPAKILPFKPDELIINQLQWIENIERNDLDLSERLENIIKIIQAYKKTKNQSDITAKKLSELLNCSLQQALNYHNIITSSNEELKYLIKNKKINSIDKAATIAKSDIQIQANLINACLNGVSLKELKHLASQNNNNQTKLKSLESEDNTKSKSNNINQRGNSSENNNIYLGKTNNYQTVKDIIISVLANPKYQHLVDIINKKIQQTDWSNSQSCSNLFQEFIKVIEKNNT